MKNLLISLITRFLQPTALNGKLTKDLLKSDSSDSTIHLDLNKMDFGEEAKNQILKDMTCLGAQMRSEPWTVNAIGQIAVMMPHVITEREVSFVKDEWKLYQAANISKDWYIDSDTKKTKKSRPLLG
ncbi:uncharacterized protein LOC124810036 isoform X2 [Hydra vulgaris]|uniref:uncharacterized protein LOC124810036 isoform X2 n=1 Tax=Hydra vulgaris TaxID=6087 RepID=UPI001F5F2C31|nr:uncharacterized protein LOC124810036 isoform X2 [Hydra vulgaris]